MKRLRKWIKRLAIALLVLSVISLIAFLIYFPGQQASIAFSLATGLGIPGLQERVDTLEEVAIVNGDFSDEDKQFLKDLYTCFAKGGRLTYVYRQSGQMMTRYLSLSGDNLSTDSRIFTGSAPVLEQMNHLRNLILNDLQDKSPLKTAYISATFNMADPTFPDSIAGLYYGTLTAYPHNQSDGSLLIQWRAEVPWIWPNYDSIYQEYGKYHARVFPIPNARSLLQGTEHCLYMDDGLGAHLEDLGLAKSFVVYSEWQEIIENPRQQTK